MCETVHRAVHSISVGTGGGEGPGTGCMCPSSLSQLNNGQERAYTCLSHTFQNTSHCTGMGKDCKKVL